MIKKVLSIQRTCLQKRLLFRVAQIKNNKKTYYQILEITTNASMTNVKQNYLKLAKIYHPDVYKGKDQTRFQYIQQAYQVLSNKVKRNKYDEEIGVNKNKKESEKKKIYQQAFSYGKEKEGSAKTSESNKPKNTMQYETKGEQVDEKVDLDEEYHKFFKVKPKTKFQEIVITEEPQIRGMSQAQRIRRHFREVYQADEKFSKILYQKQFPEILGDQINQRNRMQDDRIRDQKIYVHRNSPKGIWSLKLKIFVGFGLGCVISFPLILSFATKYRIDKEKIRKIQELLKETQQEVQGVQAANRLKF